MISTKIKKLRQKFSKYNIDGYIVPKNDEYFNEYSSPDRLKFISDFDGSAGLAVILFKKNYLFVDGRYTIQAKFQSGKNFNIFEIHKKLPWKVLKHRIKLGYNPYCFTSIGLKRYFKNYFTLVPIHTDLVRAIKSKKINNKFFFLKNNISGESSKNKIKKVINFLNKDKSDCIFITAPENVAWLLNIRGKDNPHSPIPNCRVILKKNGKIHLFTKKTKIQYLLKKNNSLKITLVDQNKISIFLKNLNSKKIILDKLSCSLAYENLIKNKIDISSQNDPIYNMKSIKNNIEIKNIIKSHIFDGVAVTKFLYWIKKCKKKITELAAEKKLEYFRKKNQNYLYPSFNTISASGAHGAIIHYRATKNSNRLIKKQDIYLCDSGGQYKYGTTDVTRTICFSKPKQRIKNIYTKVLKGHIAVATSNLKKDNIGKKIDKRARKFLKQSGLDYAHGTGHGVGFFLNVHEGPQSITKINKIKIKEGMIVSNEPGYYEKNKFGIRIENLVYVKKLNNKIYFENLTLAPIEKELISYNLLSKLEKNYLFKYHLEVYSKLSKYLNLNEKKWLATFI